ncbi:MAG: hypothetical protein A2X18_08805 [Bacteroidetes bacterium GWF2_40_14]|nr:MAG: hypothetical protein A2X18_08805 [Bacteroidetes bacterium GWF2_40_14]
MRSVFLLSALLLLDYATASAQKDSVIKPEIYGYVRGSLYGGGDKYNYSNVFGELSLKARYQRARCIAYTELRFRSGEQFEAKYSAAEIIEAYCGYSGEKIEITLGNQIVNCGRSDGFNPTGNITASNYFFLTPNPDDQHLSNFMLRVKLSISPQIDIDIIGIPVFKASVYRYDLFDMGNNIRFEGADIPDKSFRNGSVALKLNFEFPAIGFSLSYFRGYDPYYGFKVASVIQDKPTSAPMITNKASPYLKNTLGFDFTLPAGSWMIRGEFAYDMTTDYKFSIHIPNPSFKYVIGIEKDILGIKTIFQYIGKKTFDFTPLTLPESTHEILNYEFELFNRKIFNQQKSFDYALSIMLSKYLFQETVNFELAGYFNTTSSEYYIRPKLSWNITDNITTSLGCYYMNGPDKSVFNYSSHILNGGFAELRVSF